jgi:hypothetical protein
MGNGNSKVRCDEVASSPDDIPKSIIACRGIIITEKLLDIYREEIYYVANIVCRAT